MKVPFLIIGSGLSGLGAAIRFARFFPDVILLDKHSRIGGLNSYYFRNNSLIETGLHAITNFALPSEKKAPLNRLFRQLKLSRKLFTVHEQIQSEICFQNQESLLFSNNFELLESEIHKKFPHCGMGFQKMVAAIDRYDPFTPQKFFSARKFLNEHIEDSLLTDMILCPLMYYGSSLENDMDLYQFVIMFRSIFQEGMFRPRGTIKDFLDTLLAHYKQFGGELRLQSKVVKILHNNKKVTGVELESGEIIHCDFLLSTIGYEETMDLLSIKYNKCPTNRLGFVESIFQLPTSVQDSLPRDKTIIFYNKKKHFRYGRPTSLINLDSGVICFPANFQNLPPKEHFEVRATHLSNYEVWKKSESTKAAYLSQKQAIASEVKSNLEKKIGNFRQNIVYEDTYTPLTIERFTAKKEGAIYGSPSKIKDGELGYKNLFLAGTDQGLLGIIGSMLSGVTMVNQHILSKF